MVWLAGRPRLRQAHHGQRFRHHWTRRSRPGTPGRSSIAEEIRDLIRKMSRANSSWGSPRIQSELRKLGIDVAKSTVEK
jgi:hypothetical protein